MTLHCPFNNVPCMRNCDRQAVANGLPCLLQLAHQDLQRMGPEAITAVHALTHWWLPPPTARRPYDGSLDDWDVDEFTPVVTNEAKLARIAEILESVGVELNTIDNGEDWPTQLELRFGKEIIRVEGELSMWNGRDAK